MLRLLRWMVEIGGRQRAAQVIVLDGGAEVARTGAFLKGAVTGAGVAGIFLALAAPSTVDRSLVEEARRREQLLADATRRANESAGITHACLNTARTMQSTLDGYQGIVESYQEMMGERRPPPLNRVPGAKLRNRS